MPRIATVHDASAYAVFGVFAGVPFWPGGLTVVAGSPGVGKTSWGLRMLADAVRQGYPAALACYEHTPEELKARLRAQTAGRLYGPHRQAGEDATAVEQELAHLANGILLHLDSEMDTVRTVESLLLDEGFPAHGPALLVFDYLQRAPVVNRMGAPVRDEYRAGEAAAALKRLALRRGWAVVAVSAVGKADFQHQDYTRAPETALAALLGDERLPYAADRVYLLTRTGTLDCGCCHRWDCVTAKNRMGTTGVREMMFWGQRFYPFFPEERP